MLSRVTLQRLQRLPQIPSVWEGDRRGISSLVAENLDLEDDTESVECDCILWVDGTQGAVRSMTIVPSESGYEPIVRAFLQAMESPQGPVEPGRPKKIVVRDREIQFYLRGALQGLDITIDYAPDLPLIDELFSALQQMPEGNEPQLPEQYAEALINAAFDIWDVAPWNILNEQQLIAIELNAWDIDTLYVSVLGMAGVEYGLLMYRSLESLTQFRQRVLAEEKNVKQMREAFLEQDCLYLNFELLGESADDNSLPPHLQWLNNAPEAIQPDYGSIHPLEGLRANLEDEEGMTLLVAIGALQKFFKKHYSKLEQGQFPALEGRYRMPRPDQPGKSLNVTVKTLPDIADELMEQTEVALAREIGLELPDFPSVRDEIVPEGSMVLLTEFPQEWLDCLHKNPTIYSQNCREPAANSCSDSPAGLPVVLIQTSRPKAKAMIQQIQQAGGIQAVVFNSGTDPFSGDGYELGLLQTGQGELHLFAEYVCDVPRDRQIVERWHQWRQDYHQSCGVVIAAGVTGAARGKPTLKDMLALIETRSATADDLNLPPLQLQYAMDWEG